MAEKELDSFFAVDQIIGKREVQEDCLDVDKTNDQDEHDLFCLTDGMGGHAAGDLASKLALESSISHYKTSEKEDISRKLFDAATIANREIAKRVQENNELEGMGCTLILATLINDSFFWCSVGDSLILLYRDNKLLRINEDHSMKPVLEKMHIDGLLSEEELKTDSSRNALRSSIYGEVIELIDHPEDPLDLERDDLIIIASDGIETLENEEIIESIKHQRKNGPDTIIKDLFKKIEEKNNKNQDNTSLIIIDNKKRL